MHQYVVGIDSVNKDDVALVGGKGANLGEMTQAGLPVPQGFVITSKAYYEFLKTNNVDAKIQHLLGMTNFDDPKSLNHTSEQIKKLILEGKIPEHLIEEIFDAYIALSGPLKNALVAVRSSATAEDLKDASFAGQQTTHLNIFGEANLLLHIKDVWASLFEARAIFYRHERRFDQTKIGIAVVVQKMVNSDISGVMFSQDPLTNDKNKIVIEAIWGLGELIVQGAVTPDQYEVDKQSLKLIDKKLASQDKQLVRKGASNKEIAVEKSKQNMQKLSEDQITHLAELAKKLEHHYYFPQDTEWAIENNNISIVQTRAITTTKMRTLAEKETSKKITQELLLTGDPASPGMAFGPVKVLQSAKEIDQINQGDILVAPQTNPDFVPAMKKAAAIVTDKGGRTSHAAIISRELGIPAVVGAEKATTQLKTGDIVTVNGSKGEIYKGAATLSSTPAHHTIVDEFTPTATKVYVNLAQPDLAEKISLRPVDGIGLLRAEFIMANIGTHPKKMIREGKQKEYIQQLANDIARFCQNFAPRPVIYRTSDMKTNEYRHLIGGKDYEPEESNPMLGYRGAFRYIHDPEVFHLELEAIKMVRNNMNLKNLWTMIPFVRTVDELIQVKKLIAAAGLYRSPSFKIWMMVEIPSNVILLEQFLAVGIDGISIGSNDLTMLLLGTDRDNNEVASAFSEENPAVLWALEHVIQTCHKHNITVSLCGQAPTQRPQLLENLVKWGITSVSVSPDVIESTRTAIATIEKKLISQ